MDKNNKLRMHVNWLECGLNEILSENSWYLSLRASPKCYECPKKHTGPTIWFHSIKLKLFKIQLSGSSLALFWFCKTVISEKSKNKSLNLLIKINLKSFNLIEWNQIVGPMCFWDICNIWEPLWWKGPKKPQLWNWDHFHFTICAQVI